MINIKRYNTFGVNAEVKRFEILQTREAVVDFIKEVGADFLVMGGGSNILFVSPKIDVACKIDIKGIEYCGEYGDYVYVEVGAGEIWSDFVDYCVERGWGGIENLTLIPGSVGAAAVQNIGAYGVEISDSIVEVHYVDTTDLMSYKLLNIQCEFGYRNSVFKHELKGRAVITSVVFRLLKEAIVKTNYKDVSQFMLDNNISKPNVKDVCEAVKSIRRGKLPDVNELGSAGSFFKNPVVSEELGEKLKFAYPDMITYKVSGGYKLSAAWLIENVGLKGYRIGDAGVYDKHALILINHGNATGREIGRLSICVIEAVKRKFGVILEPEVIMI